MGDNNNIQENNSKKRIIFMIIGLVIMLILVIGSTYAYFNVNVNDSENHPTNITATTEKVGEITLKSLESNLYLNVSAEDMAMDNADKTYYATPDQSKGREVSDTNVYYNIAQVSVSNGNVDTNYLCSAEIKITATGNMLKAIHDNGYDDEYILTLGLKSTEFGREINLYNIYEPNIQTIKWDFRIQGNNKIELQAYLSLYNSEWEEQNYLAGKNLELNIETSNLNCEVYENTFKGGNGLQLAQSKQLGLNNELVGDMYRFQGTLANNYLCFGQKCDNLSKDMYRIIGITKEGNMKIIKQTSIGDKQWHHCSYEGDNTKDEDACGIGIEPPEWNESDLHNYLNDEYYNNLNENLKNKIEEVNWKYGDIRDETANITGLGVYEIENAWQNATQANISLMYLSDYYLASSNTANCYDDSYDYECATSWIHKNQNDSYIFLEWIMTRYNKGYAWAVYREGLVSYYNIPVEQSVRPVFFLKSTEVISSGTGTPENPFVIE